MIRGYIRVHPGNSYSDIKADIPGLSSTKRSIRTQESWCNPRRPLPSPRGTRRGSLT